MGTRMCKFLLSVLALIDLHKHVMHSRRRGRHKLQTGHTREAPAKHRIWH